MKNVKDIFVTGPLTVAVGECHTIGQPQLRLSLDNRSVRLSIGTAKEMAEEILYWVSELPGGAEGDK